MFELIIKESRDQGVVALYARSHHPSLALLACLACLRVGKACGGGSPIAVRDPNGSVNSKCAHRPPGFCRAFVILFWKRCKCPKAGPGVHTNTHLWLSTLILVHFAAVIRVVTQRSSPKVLWGRGVASLRHRHCKPFSIESLYKWLRWNLVPRVPSYSDPVGPRGLKVSTVPANVIIPYTDFNLS